MSFFTFLSDASRGCLLEIFQTIRTVGRCDSDHHFGYLFAAVMQTEGFEHLKVSCPSILSELLEHVAKMGEHSVKAGVHVIEAPLDGSDVNGRRVKPRII